MRTPTIDERTETQVVLDRLHRRNIFLALLIRGEPKLHMTLRFYAESDRDLQDRITLAVSEWLAEHSPVPFRCHLLVRDMFGPRRNIPVLLASKPLPAWTEELRNLVLPTSPDKYDGFRPHVTTRDHQPGIFLVDAVALMHRKTILTRWQLKSTKEDTLWA